MNSQHLIKEIEKIMIDFPKGLEEFSCSCESCSKTRKRVIKGILALFDSHTKQLKEKIEGLTQFSEMNGGKYQTEKQYFKDYTCDNCGETFAQWFDFGVRASQGVCPNCGCSPKENYEYNEHKIF